MSLADTAQLSVQLNMTGNFGTASARAQKDLANLDKASAKTTKSTGLLSKQFAELKKGFLMGAGLGGGVVAFTAIQQGVQMVGDAIGNAIGSAGAFEEQMATINTIARLSGDALGDMGDQISELSLSAGRDTADLTAGMYDLLSAGVDAADAMGVLEDATTLARGALSTTEEAVDLLTTTINAFGMEASDSARLIDIFAKTVELGKVTASELAASMADIAPIAASVGVAIEDVAAVYATMTASGVPAAEAAQNLRQAIVALITPSEELTALQKSLNVNFADMLRARGVGETFKFLSESVDNSTGSLALMLGRVQALQAVLLTTNENAEGFADNFDAITTAADKGGIALQQAAIRADTFAGKQDRLNAAVGYFNRELGEIMLGPAGDFLEWMTDIIDGTPQLEGKVLELAEKLGIVGDKLEEAAKSGDSWADYTPDIFETGDAIGYTVDRLEGLGKTLGYTRRDLEALIRATLEHGGDLDVLEGQLAAEAAGLTTVAEAMDRVAGIERHIQRENEDFNASLKETAFQVIPVSEGLKDLDARLGETSRAEARTRRNTQAVADAMAALAGEVDLAGGSFKDFWDDIQAQQKRQKFFIRHPDVLRNELDRLDAEIKRGMDRYEARTKGGITDANALWAEGQRRILDTLRAQRERMAALGYNAGVAYGNGAERGAAASFDPSGILRGTVSRIVARRGQNKGESAAGGVLFPGDYGTVGERGMERVSNKGGVTVIEPMGGRSMAQTINVTVRPLIPAYEVNRELGRIGTTRRSGAGVL